MSTIKTIDVKVNGLHPNKKYRFNFANKGGNWPVRVSPLSGVFYPSSVKTYVYFCSTTGECPPSDANVFFNTPATDISIPGLALDNRSLYSVLQLSISEFDCDDVVYTHPCIVECDECIPKLAVTTNSVALGAADGPETPFSSSVDGLVPNQTYKYEFSGVGGNWPVKIIPRSGVIKTSDTSYAINGLLSVCQSTGVCPSGNANVLNYTSIPNSADLLYSMVELSVEPVDTINSNFQATTTSAFAVQCDDCIHRLNINTPTSVNLSSSTTSVTANLINTIPGRTYSYTVQPVDANWPVLVHPYSGTVLATSDYTNLAFSLRFCPSTGLCPSGTQGLMPYTLSSSDLIPKQARFKIKVEDSCADTATVCSNNAGPTTPIYSNEITTVCQNCLPSPVAQSTSVLSLTDNSKQSFTTTLTNLIPGATYTYSFKGLGGNWPAIITPTSGSLLASSNLAAIPAEIAFCPSTGICANNTANVLTYTTNSSQTDTDTQSFNTKFRLELTNSSYDLPKVYSNDVLAICDKCLPKLSATLPTNITLSDAASYDIAATVNNTIPGQTYAFTVKSIDSNWPTTVYPASGSIVASANSESIPLTVQFCSSTGICPSDSPTVLDYVLDSANSLMDKRTRFKLELTPNYAYPTVTSNELSAVCQDCIAAPKAIVPVSTTLTDAQFYTFNSNLSNLIPGESYKFIYKSVNANWPAVIYPLSGIITAVDSTFTIPTKLTFCASTGSCPNGTNGVLSYAIDPSCSLGDQSLKNVSFRLELEPVNPNYSKTYSNQMFVNCDNCLDSLQVSVPSYVTLDNTDSYEFNATVSNMVIGRSYKYEFKSVDANWPAVLYPVSGIIVATSQNTSFNSKLTFCPSTGVCPTGSASVLPYSVSPTCISHLGGIDKNVKLKLEVTDVSCTDIKVTSNEFIVACDDCLQKLSVANSGGTQSIITSSDDNVYTLQSVVNNLIPGESYKYTVNYVDSNWPTIISRQSGEFKAVSSTKLLKTNLGFCYPSGSCVGETDAILTYKNNSVYNKSGKKFLTVNLNVDAVDCSVPRAYSDDFTLVCDNCLPLHFSVQLSGAPSITLDQPCCSGSRIMTANAFGVIPGDTYAYYLTSTSNKITFSPSSGTVSFPYSGSGSLMYTMNSVMTSGDQSIINIRLINNTSNIEATDYLAVRCDNESCL